MTMPPHVLRRDPADEGNALIEAALVLPFLLLVCMGIVEFGLGFTAANRVESASSTAARVGAADGHRVEADRDVLVSVKAALDSTSLANLDRVIVYLPDVNGAMPSGCDPGNGNPATDTGVVGKCNSYGGNTVRAVASSSMVGFGGTGSAKDHYWSPSGRLDTLAGPPQMLGVMIRTKYTNQTRTYWGDFVIKKQSIYQLQPDFDG
jgi:hypothetical protein